MYKSCLVSSAKRLVLILETMIWILLTFVVAASSEPIRICVTEALSKSCQEMENALPDYYKCVTAPDVFGCLIKVKTNEADCTNVDPKGVYLGGSYFGLEPIATELANLETFLYQAIAVVQKSSDIQSAEDLRDRRSCHTGMERTAGYKIPLGRLYTNGDLKSKCRIGELATVENYFKASCIPGKWSSDPDLDARLKTEYRGLCSLCKNPAACAEDDFYAGYEGVLNCIVDDTADVAFTKIPALKSYLQKHPEFEHKAEILCYDGGRKNLSDPQPCIWGSRPTNAYLISPKRHRVLAERLANAFNATRLLWNKNQLDSGTPEWYYKTFLSSNKVNDLEMIDDNRSDYHGYLGDFIHAVKKPFLPCGSDEVYFCTTSSGENDRCIALSKVAAAHGLKPDIQCEMALLEEDCMENVRTNNTDVVTLDAGDAYTAGKYYGLNVIASELYNTSDVAYYAVALLRSASDVSTLADLKGLASCHTGMGRAEGWVMPIDAMISEGLLQAENRCNRSQEMANFFLAGSCVPGANDTTFNPQRIGNEILCKQCTAEGGGESKCFADHRERYNGDSGALRCLAEGESDVAFLKHLTVITHTDGSDNEPWGLDLLPSDFKLLCPGGGTAPVTEYMNCNLGKVPSAQILANSHLTKRRYLEMETLLSSISDLFSSKSNFFKYLRGQTLSQPNSKHFANAYKTHSFGTTVEDALGKKIYQAFASVDTKGCF